MGEMHESATIRSWAEWFERRAQHYDNPLMKMAYYVEGHPIPIEVMQATIEDVWGKLRATSQSSVLDVGGGVGLFSQVFRPWLRSLIGTDISFSMIRDAYRLNPEGTFLVCEAATLPFVSCRFDRLLCYSVFHYLSDLSHARKALNEFVRVVKNGGLILVGDVPFTQHMQSIEQKSSCALPIDKPVHYPASLWHTLKHMTYEERFFVEFCTAEGHRCEVLTQDIKGRASSSYRFDILIEVAKS